MAIVQQYKQKSSHWVRGAFLATLLLLFCWQVVQASWFFNLEYVEVRGNETISPRQVEEIAGVWRGAQLLKLNLREIERRLIADPRIVAAEVTRRLPNKLRISIEENIGLAVIPYYDSFIEVDGTGRVVSIVNNFCRVNLPIITGVNVGEIQIGSIISTPEFEAARIVISHLPSSTRPVISEVHVVAKDSVNLITTTGINIKFGSAYNAASRLALLPAVLYAYEVRQFNRATIEFIDMTGDIPVYKGR